MAAPVGGPAADVEGREIALTEVGRYHCQDLDYPRIHCFTTAAARDASVGGLAFLTASGTPYVLIFEQPSFAGASMLVSEDYSALALIGWNDQISSFKAQNSQTGRFWTDWLYSGKSYSFCCSTQVPSLGSFDNVFSSVERT